MRRRVRLTEGQLRDVVEEAARRVIQEIIQEKSEWVPTATGWEFKQGFDTNRKQTIQAYNNGRPPTGSYNPNTNTYYDPNTKTGHSIVPPGPPRPYWAQPKTTQAAVALPPKYLQGGFQRQPRQYKTAR